MESYGGFSSKFLSLENSIALMHTNTANMIRFADFQNHGFSLMQINYL